jgi:cytochrome c biogenesis protein CcmG/thiol:disulfide interchange protein DsbE
VPSPLVGKAVPEFTLPQLKDPNQALSHRDLTGKVSLLNAWATWCVECRREHSTLVGIAREGRIPIYGLNYKDERPEAIEWLRRLGDPYVASAYDPDGRVGIDLGVYGLPETFLVDAEGRIAHKHIGPIDQHIWDTEFAPIVARLEGRGG